jgi:hypothetical protein
MCGLCDESYRIENVLCERGVYFQEVRDLGDFGRGAARLPRVYKQKW